MAMATEADSGLEGAVVGLLAAAEDDFIEV